jgi:hypothetical protein
MRNKRPMHPRKLTRRGRGGCGYSEPMAHMRQFEELASDVIRIRVTPAQRRELEQVAHDNRLTLSATIREAVDEFTADYRENKAVFGNRGTRSNS